MAQTIIAWGDPQAQEKWSPLLAVDVAKKSYFGRKFVGKGENNIIEQKSDLESDAGDRVSFDLSVQLRQAPTAGDNRVKGTEEQLRFFSDEVIIDQLRHPVSAGGRMSRKRTVHDLRRVAKNRLSDYWKQYIDELFFIYLAGARGINEEFIESTAYTGHAGNALQAPDAQHQLYAGSATSKATITSSDKMTRDFIERACISAQMMRALDPEAANMVPVSVEGEDHYVALISPFQEFDMRTDTGTTGWMEIQKAAAGAEGRKSRIFTGGLGMINNAILHCHPNTVRFSDYGAGANLQASRAMFMGRQAGVVAYGTPKGRRYMWKEEMEDYDNEPTVVAGCIIGVTATQFNNRRFGMIALDSYAVNPNP